MSRIAILHPQCVRPGGAIQMALQACHVLQQQGHEVTLSTFEKSDTCFPDLQDGIVIQKWGKKTRNKLSNIITLAFHLRHFDIIIANNPPMQIVAALAKVFSLRFKIKKEDHKKINNSSLFIRHYSLSSLTTVWWHHHVPWYISPGNKIKSFFERHCIIPRIDQMVATSHFVGEKIREYCGRDSVVVHPIISSKYHVLSIKTGTEIAPHLNTQYLIPNTDTITLFTHGRLEAGKGIDTLVRVFQTLRQNDENIQLIIFGTGSLEQSLREQGIVVQTFQGNDTFQTLSSGQFGHVVGVYCSSIDAFGMASLESQMAGFPTIMMDRGGAREAILSDDDHHPVGHLVHSEEELLSTISRYVQNKILEKQMSNVNFSHKRDYFSPERLSRDLLSIITKIGS